MNIVFRVDASFQIGSGHVMRCLTLADALREQGASVSFICRDLPGHMGGLIEGRGFSVHLIPVDVALDNEWGQIAVDWQKDAQQTINLLNGGPADWLIVDQYALDRKYEDAVRSCAHRIMVIDDKADRPHRADFLLDQNLFDNPEVRYQQWLPKHTRCLFGPTYALLRPQFRVFRQKRYDTHEKIRRIFVSFGGVDATNETAKVLTAFRERPDIELDVVLGGTSLHREEVYSLAASMPNVTVYTQVENMAELMSESDLAFGAGGTTTWERCCLGIPTFVTIVADNQRQASNVLSSKGVIEIVGVAADVTAHHYADVLNRVTPGLLERMKSRGMELVDGEGTDRVREVMYALLGR